MLDSLAVDSYWPYLLRFLCGSTLLFTAVWLAESLPWLRSPRLRAQLWRLAVFASLLLLLPWQNPLAPTLQLDSWIAAPQTADSLQFVEAQFVDTHQLLDTHTSDSIQLGDTYTSAAARSENPLLDTHTSGPSLGPLLDTHTSGAASVENSLAMQPAMETLTAGGPLLDAGAASLDASLDTHTVLDSHESDAGSIQDTHKSVPQYLLAPQATPIVGTQTPAQTLALNLDSTPTAAAQRQPVWSVLSSIGAQPNAGAAVLIAWFVISLLLLSRLALGYRRGLQRLGSRPGITADDPRARLLAELGCEMGLKRLPKLSTSAHINSPVTLPGHEICLPNWTLQDLPAAEQRSLLAHELGHIKHRDLQVQLALHVLASLFFFQPWFMLVQRRLADLSEFIADEAALTYGGCKHSVSELLLECAERCQRQRPLQWGFAMVGNPSRLRLRIQQLQEHTGLEASTFTKIKHWAVVALLSVLLLALPGFEFGLAQGVDTQTDTSEVKDSVDPANDPAATGASVDAEADIVPPAPVLPPSPVSPEPVSASIPSAPEPQSPPIAPTPARSAAAGEVEAIATTPSGATLSIETAPAQPPVPSNSERFLAQVDTNERVESRRGSSLIRSLLGLLPGDGSNYYRVNNDRHRWRSNDLDADWEGRLQFSQAEDDIVAISSGGFFEMRSLSLGPDRRISYESDGGELSRRFWRDGSESPLDEADRDWLQASLLRLLRSTGYGAEDRVERMLAQTGTGAVLDELQFLDSDRVMRRYSEALSEQVNLSETEIDELLDRLDSVSSDLELRLILTGLSAEQSLSLNNLASLVALADSISSDLEKRLLITTLLEQLERSPAVTAQLLMATEDISSDLEMRIALSTILERGDTDADDIWPHFLRAAQTVSSDLELRLLLTTAVEVAGDSQVACGYVVTAAESISSDLEMRIALSSLLTRGQLDGNAWRQALLMIDDEISSSREKATLLLAIASHVPDDPDLRSLYNDTVLAISSSAERMRLSPL